jgi:hypothetical protein
MNRSIAIVFVAVLAAFSAIPAIGQAKSEDEAKIEALVAAYTAAVNSKDLDGITKVYVPDASLVIFDIIPARQYLGAGEHALPILSAAVARQLEIFFCRTGHRSIVSVATRTSR